MPTAGVVSMRTKSDIHHSLREQKSRPLQLAAGNEGHHPSHIRNVDWTKLVIASRNIEGMERKVTISLRVLLFVSIGTTKRVPLRRSITGVPVIPIWGSR